MTKYFLSKVKVQLEITPDVRRRGQDAYKAGESLLSVHDVKRIAQGWRVYGHGTELHTRPGSFPLP
jgi:hypothetical protein